MLAQKNSHPRDERIHFECENHKYFIDGCSDYISVTTLIKEFFPKFDSDLVINKMQKSEKWSCSPYYGMTKEEIQKCWSDKAQSASELGTLLHNTIEDFYNRNDCDPSFGVPCTIAKEFEQFRIFYIAVHSGLHLTPYRTEWCVFDEDYHVAGSIDMSFIDETTGEIHLYDWKRTPCLKKENRFQRGFCPLSHLDDCKYNHYSLQLNIYKFILESKYDKKIAKMHLVCLHPDNQSYIMEEVFDLQKEVRAILEKNVESKFYLCKNEDDKPVS